MDIFNNVLEGTRQYFMGVPKQVQPESAGQSVWPSGAPLPEEGAPAQSGAPAPSSRPPSAAAAPPAPIATPVPVPPRPPSEPLEPEPHIIHKATVMREAAEKRREMPDIEDEEEPAGTLSPPSHIIRKPQRGERSLPSPAPAPAAPSPSPARPPSAAPSLPPSSALEPQLEPPVQYRPTMHRVQTPTVRPPDHFAPGRPPDPYGPSRPPDSYQRYHYETNTETGRSSHGSITSTQPSAPQRQSPQTYTRISNSMPQHTASRLRDSAAHSPPAQRYVMPHAQPPPPHNDRVPPIHHPQPLPSAQRHMPVDSRSTSMYANLQQRRETSPYARASTQYDRHPVAPPRKYDPQQAYPGYRPSAAVPQVPQSMQNHRVDIHPQVQYKPAPVDVINTHYATRTPDRLTAPPHTPHEAARLQSRGDYMRSIESRPSYHYLAPSTSTSRYGSAGSVPVVQSTSQSRNPYRSAAAPKSNYVYPTSTPVQISPARSTVKPGYPNQKARMTVSVTSIVNEINGNKQKRRSPGPNSTQVNTVSQTKQKRESPLDLSVKTVKNSADSSTTQDDAVDSMTIENKPTPLHTRSSSSSRLPHVPLANYVGSLKVDFAPNFIQYGERNAGPNYSSTTPAGPSARYNGSFNPLRPIPESYPTESPNLTYPERKYSVPVGRSEFPQIDLTQPIGDQAHPENRIRDDRHFIIEERKRPEGPIVSNIPEKMVRYETWSADSRIEHGIMNPSTREHHDLLRRPVYSYTSHKQTEAYRNEQKRLGPPLVYRELHPHANHRYPSNNYPTSEAFPRDNRDYHHHYHERNQSHSRHHVIQKTPSHRDVHPHHLDPNSGIPADKRVLSILRNSLETKQSSYTESPRPVKQVPDLIVIDDVDDSVIEITDLTKDNEIEGTPAMPTHNHLGSNLDQQLIKMPKAVDSIPRESDDYKLETNNAKSKSPENDVASRIRTKAELKVMPPTQDNTIKTDTKQNSGLMENDKTKILPKSQKQHLFNQIREDNLRMKSVIKKEKQVDVVIPEVKTEPMNIDEIERDAEMSLKTEDFLDNINPTDTSSDLDWASACDNFMEQLKSGCHKKKTHRRRVDTLDQESENKAENVDPKEPLDISEKPLSDTSSVVKIKQEPVDDDEINYFNDPTPINHNTQLGEEICHKEKKSDDENVIIENNVGEKPKSVIEKPKSNQERIKHEKKNERSHDKPTKSTKIKSKSKIKPEKNESSHLPKKEMKEKEPIKTIIKEEIESTDDDEPLINSKILKEKKEQSDRMKYQLLKDLSEKSAYVKLECCDVDVNKNNRKSLDSMPRERDEKLSTGKLSRQSSRSKIKNDNNQSEKRDANSTSDSEDDLSVAIRLRKRKNTKNDDNKSSPAAKTPVKSSPMKKFDNSSASSSSTPVRKPGFGDGSDFHPGWEEELYKYKRSLRMPSRLIAIPRGRSGGPFFKGSGALFTRGSTSLPDLDPAPLSPAPSSAPSAATDDIYARRPDKLTLDSDLDSNSSYSAPNRLNYDSEASTSTVFSSSKTKNKGSSIVDVLIQKCGKKDESKKKSKDKDDRVPKVIPKSSNTTELLATPSLGLGKNGTKGILSVRKEKIMEDIFYLGAFRKETVTAFRNAFIENTGGIIGATEEFSAVVLKSRTRTESRVLKQRATIKEVFGDERPASAPPTSCRDDDILEDKDSQMVEIKKEPEAETEPKSKFKSRKMNKDKLQRRSSSIRDGLRSTKSLKRNDAKGRLLRLKKRNSLINLLNSKRMKDISNSKPKSEYNAEDKSKPKEESSSLSASEVSTKRRLKRLFGRRKFSSGFDYIRKKKKIIRREDAHTKIRRPAVKPSPESVHDIQKEIKSWFINKSIGETHLHRAARLGYTDCVAYCLEKMESEPSSKDNAGFTPLHVAAAKGHVPIARLLLQYGANVSAAAQGGIRPLHEACENCHVEIIRLLLAYGADPLLGTYAGQTPEELTEGPAALLLRLHIADVQGFAVEPWRFPPLAEIIDRDELGCDPLSSPPPASPPPPPDSMVEIQCTEAPLPPFYTLRTTSGQPADGLWCLLQDITNLLQIKSKDNLLKQIHCGSGSPKELLREIRTQEFLERAQCHQLLCAGEKVNVRASKVALVRVTDKLRQLLKIETVLVS